MINAKKMFENFSSLVQNDRKATDGLLYELKQFILGSDCNEKSNTIVESTLESLENSLPPDVPH